MIKQTIRTTADMITGTINYEAMILTINADKAKKKRAKDIVYRACKSKKINRTEVCGCCGYVVGYTEFHHCNYDEPLNVIPLCRSCHSSVHRSRSAMEKVER